MPPSFCIYCDLARLVPSIPVARFFFAYSRTLFSRTSRLVKRPLELTDLFFFYFLFFFLSLTWFNRTSRFVNRLLELTVSSRMRPASSGRRFPERSSERRPDRGFASIAQAAWAAP